MSKHLKSRAVLNSEYKKTVLKVPDCFAVEKNAMTTHMMRAQWELFRVSSIEFNRIIFQRFKCCLCTLIQVIIYFSK